MPARTLYHLRAILFDRPSIYLPSLGPFFCSSIACLCNEGPRGDDSDRRPGKEGERRWTVILEIFSDAVSQAFMNSHHARIIQIQEGISRKLCLLFLFFGHFVWVTCARVAQQSSLCSCPEASMGRYSN